MAVEMSGRTKRPIVWAVPLEKSKAQNFHCGVMDRSRPMKLKFMGTSLSERAANCAKFSAMNFAW